MNLREIKFRAWDNKKKEWLLGYEMPNLGGFSLFGECVLFGEWSNILNQYLFDRDGHNADDLIVMQLTGLKDKDGKEIYEGDIVSYKKHDRYLLNDFVGEVRWATPGYLIKCPTKYIDLSRVDELQRDLLDHLEVVGNIYENPDLLKQ